jgi:phosphatidylglycerophosphate synthase
LYLTKPYYLAGFFIILKSIDGADGELARIKNTPLTPADTSIVF